MGDAIAWLLMLLFAAHLAGFLVLGVRRREWYYAALVVTFTLLTGSFALLLFAPTWTPAGVPGYLVVRYVAWGAAAVTISWTAVRVMMRRAA